MYEYKYYLARYQGSNLLPSKTNRVVSKDSFLGMDLYNGFYFIREGMNTIVPFISFYEP